MCFRKNQTILLLQQRWTVRFPGARPLEVGTGRESRDDLANQSQKLGWRNRRHMEDSQGRAAQPSKTVKGTSAWSKGGVHCSLGCSRTLHTASQFIVWGPLTFTNT